MADLKPGDSVQLVLPLQPRWTYPDQRIDAVRGTVAVERGPVVMCVESVHQEDRTDVSRLVVNPSVPPQDRDGAVVAEGGILTFEEADSAYSRDSRSPKVRSTEIVFTPYWAWANSGPTTMRVWVPIQPSIS